MRKYVSGKKQSLNGRTPAYTHEILTSVPIIKKDNVCVYLTLMFSIQSFAYRWLFNSRRPLIDRIISQFLQVTK